MNNMESETEFDIAELYSEVAFLVHIVSKINYLNSRGKTKEIADEIRPILKYYNCPEYNEN